MGRGGHSATRAGPPPGSPPPGPRARNRPRPPTARPTAPRAGPPPSAPADARPGLPAASGNRATGPPPQRVLLEKVCWVPPPTEPFRAGPARKAPKGKGKEEHPMTRAPPL